MADIVDRLNDRADNVISSTNSELFVEAADEIAKLRAENAKLTRMATDRRYMMDAYRAMLGPVALKVAEAWETKGVLRQHTYWRPEAHKLTGEERAQHLLDAESAPRSPGDFNDSNLPQVDVRAALPAPVSP